jgi:hypothetical protein
VTAVSAGRVDDLAVMLVLVGLAVAFVAVVRARPGAGLVAYVASIGLVPVWIGVQVGVFVGAATAVGVGVLAALWRGSGIRLTVWDGLIVFAVGVTVVTWLAGYGDMAGAYGAATSWLVPYLVGRVLVARLGSRAVAACVALVFLVVATLAVVEAATGQNLFVRMAMANPLYTQWGGIRMRGGLPRAEGAFGHAIPLGASLALAVPFVWSSRLRPALRALTLVLVGVAAVVTYSRIGMLSTVLALVLCVVALGRHASRSFRGWTVVALVVGAALAARTALAVFAEAGDEASGSADYRENLWSLLPSVDVLGRSSAAFTDASGSGGWGDFRSIDNAVLMTGLTYGSLVVVLLLVMGAGALVGLVRGPRTPGGVAVVALLPGLTSVAFITQFTAFFWFVAGVAVAQAVAVPAARRHAAADGDDTPAEVPARAVGELRPAAAAP